VTYKALRWFLIVTMAVGLGLVIGIGGTAIYLNAWNAFAVIAVVAGSAAAVSSVVQIQKFGRAEEQGRLWRQEATRAGDAEAHGRPWLRFETRERLLGRVARLQQVMTNFHGEGWTSSREPPAEPTESNIVSEIGDLLISIWYDLRRSIELDDEETAENVADEVRAALQGTGWLQVWTSLSEHEQQDAEEERTEAPGE
jgi:hypothetical protein